MTEQGVVTAIDGLTATVKVDKKDECSKCGMCLFPNNAQSVDFKATNNVGAVVGDSVIIESAEKTKFIGALLVFLVPLILVGIMATVNYLFIFSDIWFLIGSVILVILWYTILAVIDKRLSKSKTFATVIKSVINKEKINNE